MSAWWEKPAVIWAPAAVAGAVMTLSMNQGWAGAGAISGYVFGSSMVNALIIRRGRIARRKAADARYARNTRIINSPNGGKPVRAALVASSPTTPEAPK